MSSAYRKTILVVEKHLTSSVRNNASYKKDLEKLGYNVVMVDTGEQAIQIAGSGADIDLILMDIDLGDGMDGTQAAEAILEKRHLPIVFILSVLDAETLKKVECINCYGFVTRNSSAAEWDLSIKMALRLFEANKNTKTKPEQSKRTAQEPRESEDRAKLHRKALAGLATNPFFTKADTSKAFQVIAKTVADTLGVSRASIWTFTEDRSIMRCITLYESDRKRFTSGAELMVKNLPRYFQAIMNESRIVADDAQMDSRTSELTDKYLIPLGITSMLDSGIMINGLIVGVVCSEHMGPKRKWHSDEENFLSTIAAMTSQLLVNSELFSAQEELWQANQVVENSPAILFKWKVAENWPITMVSQNISQFGYTKDDLLSGTIQYSDMVHPDDLARMNSEIEEYSSNNIDNYTQEYRILTKKGEVRWVDDRTTVVRDTDGNVVEYQGIVLDITERKQAEQALLKSEKRFMALFDSLPFPAVVARVSDGKHIEVNDAHCKMMGMSRNELIGKSSVELGADPETNKRRQAQLMETGRIDNVLIEMPVSNETTKWLQYSAVLAELSGEQVAIAGCIDITERKLAEKTLEKILEEKNVLLSEIHHRVKNNMAVISSMLLLQSEFSEQKKNPEKLLKDLQTRILSMAWVHELVYESKDFAKIPSVKLLKRLTDYLKNSYQPDNKEITLQVHTEDIMLDMNNSIPLTLLITEVLTNAWKHAFTGRKAGCIEVIMEKREKGFSLIVRDDGVGVADLEKLRQPESFGYTIVHGLAQQLRGELSFSSPAEGGLQVEAWFPNTRTT